MGMTVNTNVASINAQRNLSSTQRDLSMTLNRLSSGYRINSAGDDAAGLAISENLKAQVRGLSQAERNANDGISMIQVAEGAMNEQSGILIRLRELAVQSANGTLTDNERVYITSEANALLGEIDRIADVTEFNGVKMLDDAGAGGAGTYNMQVGTRGTGTAGGDQIALTFSTSKMASLLTPSGLATPAFDTAANASTAIGSIDAAMTELSTRRSALGAVQNRLTVTVTNLSTAYENVSAANSRIRDADIAKETAALTRGQILSQAGTAVLAQANQLPSAALSLLG